MYWNLVAAGDLLRPTTWPSNIPRSSTANTGSHSNALTLATSHRGLTVRADRPPELSEPPLADTVGRFVRSIPCRTSGPLEGYLRHISRSFHKPGRGAEFMLFLSGNPRPALSSVW